MFDAQKHLNLGKAPFELGKIANDNRAIDK
jgi:hypothetical protein